MQNRPKDIERFAYIQIAAVVVGFINSLMNWDALVAMPGNSTDQQIITLAFTYFVIFALLYFIAMRASNVARWIIVVLTVLGMLFMIPIMTTDAIPIPGGKVIPLLMGLAQLFSLWFLFTPAARNWFSKKTDPTIFN